MGTPLTDPRVLAATSDAVNFSDDSARKKQEEAAKEIVWQAHVHLEEVKEKAAREAARAIADIEKKVMYADRDVRENADRIEREEETRRGIEDMVRFEADLKAKAREREDQANRIAQEMALKDSVEEEIARTKAMIQKENVE